MAPIDFSLIETPPAYIRKADGLLVPDGKFIKTSYDAMLPGIIPGAGLFTSGPERDPFAVSYVANYTSSGGASTHNFSGVSFGTESTSREILLSVHVYDGSNNRSVSSVTIGGVSATAVINRNGATWSYGAHFYRAKPSNTSGSVSVALSGGAAIVVIGVHVCRGHSSITAGTSNINSGANTSSISLNTNVSAGQIVLGAYSTNYLTGNGNAVWTGLNEMFDIGAFGANWRRASTASHLATATESPRSISVAPSITCYKAGCTCVVSP